MRGKGLKRSAKENVNLMLDTVLFYTTHVIREGRSNPTDAIVIIFIEPESINI